MRGSRRAEEAMETTGMLAQRDGRGACTEAERERDRRQASCEMFHGNLLMCTKRQRLVMTISRYSLGTTIVVSSALFMRPMRS